MSARRTVCVAPNPIDEAVPVSIPPTGTIITYAGSTIPEGYLNCNGAEVSRNTYNTLFGAIGTTYGSGNGTVQTVTSASTAFAVPSFGTYTGYISSAAGSFGTSGFVFTLTALLSGTRPVVGTVLSGGTYSVGNYIVYNTKVTQVVSSSSYVVDISHAHSAAWSTITGSTAPVTVTLNVAAGTNTTITSGTTVTVTNDWFTQGVYPYSALTFTAGAGTTTSAIVGTTGTAGAGASIIGGLGTGTGTVFTVTASVPSTFNLPNVAGRTIRAVGTSGTGPAVTLGGKAGADTTTFTIAADNLPQHRHGVFVPGTSSAIAGGSLRAGTANVDDGTKTITGNTILDTANTVCSNAAITLNTFDQYIGFYTLISYL